MKITYKQFKDIQAKGINDFPMFFAFNDSQFEEGKQKLGITSNSELLSIGMGGYIRKTDRELFKLTLSNKNKALKEFLKDNDNLKDALVYELNNHEYFITRDKTDTLNSLDLVYDKLSDTQKVILKQAIDEYMAVAINY